MIDVCSCHAIGTTIPPPSCLFHVLSLFFFGLFLLLVLLLLVLLSENSPKGQLMTLAIQPNIPFPLEPVSLSNSENNSSCHLVISLWISTLRCMTTFPSCWFHATFEYSFLATWVWFWFDIPWVPWLWLLPLICSHINQSSQNCWVLIKMGASMWTLAPSQWKYSSLLTRPSCTNKFPRGAPVSPLAPWLLHFPWWFRFVPSGCWFKTC